MRGNLDLFGLALLVATLLQACAAGGASRAGEEEFARVRVRNDLRPAAEVTVRLISEAGVRQILGSLPPQSTRILQIDEGPFAGSFQLVAQASDGREVRSRSFVLAPFGRIGWSLFSNSLSVESP